MSCRELGEMRAATHAARQYLERERGMRDALGHALGCRRFTCEPQRCRRGMLRFSHVA